MGYYKANCQLVSLRAKTKLLRLQGHEVCSPLPPPLPTLLQALAPPWDTHTFGRDVGKHGGRNHLGDISQLGDNHRAYPLKLQGHAERHPASHLDSVLSRHTLELIPKQTILSPHPGFLSDRCLWQKGSWRPPGCCTLPTGKGTGRRAKQSRTQNQSSYSYHHFKISNLSIISTCSHEGQLQQVSDLTVSPLH